MTIGGIHGIHGVHGFHGSRAHTRLDTFPFHRPAMVVQYPDIGPDTAMGIGRRTFTTLRFRRLHPAATRDFAMGTDNQMT